ncbi:MAG TPA: thiamine-phosphate kinase [Vampirovibrionales bacterium]
MLINPEPMSKEHSIIKSIVSKFNARKFIGDDCVFLETENLLCSTDSLIEGVHFLKDTPPYSLGWKTAAVNISDIAAMGGNPKYFLLSASLPSSKNSSWINEFMDGLKKCLDKYSVQLVGGDLTNAEKVCLCGTILGSPFQGQVAKRSYAKQGDKIFLAGNLGESAAGLWALQNTNFNQFQKLKQSHLQPMPKIEEGKNLLLESIKQQTSSLIPNNSLKIPSMMDTSDSLLDCLLQIGGQSKVKMVVNLDAIAVSNELKDCAQEANFNWKEWVVSGGEDYALIATTSVSKDNLNQNNWQCIGSVEEGEGVEIVSEGEMLNLNKFQHFQHF